MYHRRKLTLNIREDRVQGVLVGAIEQVDLRRFLVERHFQRREVGIVHKGLPAMLNLDRREQDIVLLGPKCL